MVFRLENALGGALLCIVLSDLSGLSGFYQISSTVVAHKCLWTLLYVFREVSPWKHGVNLQFEHPTEKSKSLLPMTSPYTNLLQHHERWFLIQTIPWPVMCWAESIIQLLVEKLGT